jgi:hypothetical protein
MSDVPVLEARTQEEEEKKDISLGNPNWATDAS